MDGYKAYAAANAVPSSRNSAAGFVTRGGKSEAVEGKSRSRIVVIEFPSYEAALAMLPLAGIPEDEGSAHGVMRVAEIIVIEGYDGPQP